MFTFTANNIQSGTHGITSLDFYNLVTQFKSGASIFALTVNATLTFTHGYYDFGSVYFYDDFYGDDE